MKTVFQGKKFTIKQGEKPGEVTERAERSPSVGIIPITKQNNIILIREYRPERGTNAIGLIAGSADKSSNIKKEAARELAEEAKLKAKKLKLFYTNKQGVSYEHKWCCFVATGLSKINAQHDDDEIIEPFECTLDEACEYALSDNFRNETQAYALLKLRHDLQTGKFKLP